MNTTAIGRQGEQLAADWLFQQGFAVLERNWKTRWCEIDIIASKDNVIYFVEVKYRATDSYGDGFAYITTKKQRQMAFAAQAWMHMHHYPGDAQLAVVSITGTPSSIEFVEV